MAIKIKNNTQVKTTYESVKNNVKREPDKEYSDIVETLMANKEFMDSFNAYKKSITGGIDFLEKLDITFKGRTDKLIQVTKVLSAKRDNIVMLVGDAGEGKTTLAKKLMEAVNNRELDLNLEEYFVIVKVNILKMKTLGDDKLLHEMENILEHIKVLEDKAIEATGLEKLKFVAFFDEAHKLISAFGTQSKLGGDALKEGFTPAKVGVIACTTRQEYIETIAKDIPLDQRFEVVEIDRLSFEEIKEIDKSYWNDLCDRKPIYKHEELTDVDLEKMLKWGTIFFPDEAEPRRSTRILKLLEAHCRLEEVKPDIEAIKQVFRYRDSDPDVHVPIEEILDELDNLVGQELVKEQIEDWAYSVFADAGERDNKPIFVGFAYGPSGVGKTELVKLLSKAIFGTTEAILDVNIPKYADSLNGGQEMLTYIGTKVKNKKYCLINVSEYEKGVPNDKNTHLKTNVQPLFLDMLDEGICEYSDINGNGKLQTYKQSLRNTIIIFTSNAGFETQETQDKFGSPFDFKDVQKKDWKDRRAELETSARERLLNNYGISREFLGRQHAILTFTGLGEYNGIILAERILNKYFSDFEKERKIKIIRKKEKTMKQDRVSGISKDFIATELGVFIGRTKSNMKSSTSGGARQISRVVRQEIKSYIGRAIMKYKRQYGKLPKEVYITVENDGFDLREDTKDSMGVDVKCT